MHSGVFVCKYICQFAQVEMILYRYYGYLNSSSSPVVDVICLTT